MTHSSKRILKVVLTSLVLYLLAGVAVVKPQNLSLIINPKYSTPPSVFYYIKTFREKLQSLFVFGDEDKAAWDLNLASKRIEESQILSAHHLHSLAQSQMDKALAYQMEAKDLIQYLSDKTNTTYLTDEYKHNLQNIESFK